MPLPASPHQPTKPLLLDVPSAYFEVDCKAMIFGQETNDWEGSFPHEGGVNHLLKAFRDFYNEGCCYGYDGQFWDGIKKFKRVLEELYPRSGKSLHLLWKLSLPFTCDNPTMAHTSIRAKSDCLVYGVAMTRAG